MKRQVFLLLILAFASLKATAQYMEQDHYGFSAPPKLYFGLAVGMNNFTGLSGIFSELGINDNISAYGGAGLGSWGYKGSLGIKYYWFYPKKWAWNIGLSRTTGISESIFFMDPLLVNGITSSQEVFFELKPSTTLNLSLVRHWSLGKNDISRMHIEVGYGIMLTNDAYRIKDKDLHLTAQGHTFMRILQPGGLILGLGYSFALK